MNNLTKEQKFIIFWLYNRVAKNMPSNHIKSGGNDIIVDGINATEVIKNLLQDRLFVKLNNEDLDILIELLEDKLKEIDLGPEGVEVRDKPEVYINIIKKLSSIYFS